MSTQRSSITKTVKKTKTRRAKPERAPRFHLAHLTLISVVVIAAAATTAGSVATIASMDLPPNVSILLMAIAGLLTFSVALVPILAAPAWAMSTGNTKVAGFALIFLMMLPDMALQTNAAMAVDGYRTQPEITRIQSKLDAMQLAGADIKETAPVISELRRAERSKAPMNIIAFVMFAFQIGTFFSRAWLTHVTDQRDEKIKADRKAARTPKNPVLKAVA